MSDVVVVASLLALPVHASFVVGGDSLSPSHSLATTLALLVSSLTAAAALPRSLSLELWRR